MKAFVYASQKKPDTYVWLHTQDQHETLLPESLQQQLGHLRFVLEVDLHPDRHLPRADAAQVLAALKAHGWYLQLPPPPLAGAPS